VIRDVLYFGGLAWLAILLGVCAVLVARAGTAAGRIVALDLLSLVLIGLLALVAGEDKRSYALDAAAALALLAFVSTLAAARYLGDRRPFS
jgi:multicomponent Na+:H+ antiporter subunit F